MTEVLVPDAGGATTKMVDVGGFIQPLFMKTPSETQKVFESVPTFKFRKDDLMLCTFAKTGTNWMYEILMMILNKSAERVQSNKVLTMLECVSAEEADKQPSPRVVNCHYPPRYLPLDDMKAQQIKTVLCLRNPKDTAVSYYNHMKGIKMYEYEGKWENWIPGFAEGKYEYGKYSAYLLEWQREVEKQEYPLHVMFYEDLKMNGKEELDKLLKFLDLQLDDKLKCDIIDMCGFEKMQNDKGKDKMTDAFFRKDFKFYRKGQVGDWKNWFTVAQNEMFEDIWKEDTKDLTMFKFKYTHGSD